MLDPHAQTPIAYAGHNLNGASCGLILLHGRGSSVEDILGLADAFYDERISFLAPQAANNTWYPNSFLAPVEQNEPWLSSAIAKVGSLIQRCVTAGIIRNRIVLCGFSQGACLATESVARHPTHYGALIAFTGGLIGPLISEYIMKDRSLELQRCLVLEIPIRMSPGPAWKPRLSSLSEWELTLNWCATPDGRTQFSVNSLKPHDLLSRACSESICLFVTQKGKESSPVRSNA